MNMTHIMHCDAEINECEINNMTHQINNMK